MRPCSFDEDAFVKELKFMPRALNYKASSQSKVYLDSNGNGDLALAVSGTSKQSPEKASRANER